MLDFNKTGPLSSAGKSFGGAPMSISSRMQDALAGAPMVLLGAAGLWLARPYRLGTLTSMGPGFVPTLISSLLIFVGLLIAAMVPAELQIKDRVRAARGLLFVLAAMLVFSGLIERAGLVGATVAATAISVFATTEARWKEALPLGVGFAAFAVLVFVYGLGQPVRVWWWEP